jgi:crossover junction endodeoxyribonuclease RusA
VGGLALRLHIMPALRGGAAMGDEMAAPAAVAAARAPMIPTLVLPYPISANRYWRSVPGRGVLLSADARRYKEDAGKEALAAGVRPVDGPVALTVTLYRPAKRGDLDNRIKVLLDALSGIAYRDDSQVVELHAYRLDDKDHPRVEVQVLRPLTRQERDWGRQQRSAFTGPYYAGETSHER